MIGSLLAGASSVLSGAGGLGGMAGGSAGEPSSATTTTSQTLTTGTMTSGGDKMTLVYVGLAVVAFMVLSSRWRLK